MGAYYYTTSEEKKNVYHDHEDCDEGQDIDPQNRVDTDTIPANRTLCEICEGID